MNYWDYNQRKTNINVDKLKRQILLQYFNLLDHLVLVLDKKFDSLDGGSSSLGDTSSCTREHEGFKEPKFLVCHAVREEGTEG